MSEQATLAWQGIETLGGEERTNYPLALNVDDLGDGFSLNAQVSGNVGAMRVCDYMETALEQLLLALEQDPEAPLNSIAILSAAEREQLLVGSIIRRWITRTSRPCMACSKPRPVTIQKLAPQSTTALP